MNDALHGAAFHEAGHIVVARHFGQKILAVEIHEDGGGRTDMVGSVDHLSRIERIAIAYSGYASQTIFKSRTHDGIVWGDHEEISKIVEGLTDEQSLAERNAGYSLASEL